MIWAASMYVFSEIKACCDPVYISRNARSSRPPSRTALVHYQPKVDVRSARMVGVKVSPLATAAST